MEWYEEAGNFCRRLGESAGIPVEYAAAVLSILSPRNKWERNKQDAETLVRKKSEGAEISSFNVCTFTNLKTKAWNLLERSPSEWDPDAFFLGPKTRCFYDNILLGDESSRVTIDTWAARAAYNTGKKWNRTLRKREYAKLEKQYLAAAGHMNVKPLVFQATVWIKIRNELG